MLGGIFRRNWAESFKELESSEAILERVRKLENQFWKWFLFTAIVTLIGVVASFGARGSREYETALFVALVGIIGNCTVKLGASIRLSTLWMMWEARRREESELRRSIAEDL